MNRFLSRLCLISLALTLSAPLFATDQVAPGGSTVESERRRFEIKAQSVSKALRAYAEQTGEQVVYFSELGKGRESSLVEGEYTRDEALQMLLQNTGLTFQRLNPRTVAISRADATGAAQHQKTADAAPMIRLAQVDTPLRVASAQAEPPAASPPADQAPADEERRAAIVLEEVVVTGTARAEGVSKLNASFAITTVTDEQIREISPLSTADLFKVTPGVWAESSGGESGANVMVRGFAVAGDAQYATVQYAGSPIYPPSTLSFLENSTLFRIDETIDHVEALRGGPNPVFSNGQPGVTFNFIPKKGGDVADGLAKVSFSDYGLKRTDVYYGGPLSEDWSIAVGGFYRTSDGIRDTEYPADEGGQFSLNLTREMENGEANFYVRRTEDKNLFITGIPLIGSASGDSVDEFPGFNAGTGYYAGNETRLAQLEVEAAALAGGAPGTTRVDLGEGRGIDITLAGGSFDLALNDTWTFGTRFSFLQGNANTRALFNQGPPVAIEDFIDSTITAANGSAYVTGAAGIAGAGTASFTSDGSPVGAGQQVLSVGWWSVDKELESFTTDLRVSAELGMHTPTIGLYYADYSSRDLWYLGNNMVLTAQPHSRLVDIVLDNDVLVTRDGFGGTAPGAGVPFFDVNASYNGRNTALFLADEVIVTDQLRIDVGVRYEENDVNATIENSVAPPGGDFDGDPFTYYNNGGAVLGGSFRALDFEGDEISYTAGANYAFTDSMAVFVRINSGHRFPFFDELRDGILDVVDIEQYEVGFKSAGDGWGLYATAFYLELDGQNLQAFRDVDGDGIPENVNEAAGGESYGLEVEAEYLLLDAISLNLSATLQNAELVDVGAFTGNQTPRQPEIQARFTPSYRFDLPWGGIKVYTTITYVDERFQDNANLQPLPQYEKVDAGVSIDVGENFNVLIVGDNLTDEIALTEGNPRVTGTGAVNNVIIARPIQGRSVLASMTYRF